MRRAALALALVGLVGCGVSSATGQDPNVCPGEQIDPPGDPTEITITAPEGQLISAVCVKAGSAEQGDGPEFFTFDPPQKTVTVSHSTDKEISHYTVTYVPKHPTTTTTIKETTTTSTLPPTTSGPTTSGPTPTPFAIEVEPLCPDGTVPLIAITFGDRADLDGQTGTLSFSTGGSVSLTYEVGATVEIPYPASAGTGPVTMTYTLGAESVTRSTTFPEACAPPTTSTTTTVPGGTTTIPGDTTTTSTTIPGTTTTTQPGDSSPSEPQHRSAWPRCRPSASSSRTASPNWPVRTGILTMADLDGNVVSTQALVYEPGTTVDLLYPGTTVNPDGSIADVPGWILNEDGLWVRDPSDDYLRDGIDLTYTVNPTATARVTYPPESSACANPENTTTTTTTPPATTVPPVTTVPGLPVTR